MAAERREHRLALEILYAVEVGKTTLDDALRQAREQVGVFSRGDQARLEDPYEPEYPAVERRSDAPKATDWTLVEQIVRGTLAHREELAGELAALLQHWTFDRLAGIDRIVLEMGAWELRYRHSVATTDVINHAVELARRLSTAQSASFVNALLDAFAKTPVPPKSSTAS
ncbi:MAG TPA: transcription antitermination factor NusB [Candidatus Acidoferrales bacterium]|nr:transcription antitermination factor NusB [Candidatus Acidoferrales bacterium]